MFDFEFADLVMRVCTVEVDGGAFVIFVKVHDHVEIAVLVPYDGLDLKESRDYLGSLGILHSSEHDVARYVEVPYVDRVLFSGKYLGSVGIPCDFFHVVLVQ
jgi:hypothetical protein